MKISLLLTALFLVCVTGSPAIATDFVLVVNNANPTTSISLQDAKNIFLGKKTVWGNGNTIKIVTQKTPDVHELFTKHIVKKSPQQFSTYWKKALFTGTGTPPPIADNDVEAKAFVAGNPGAIGYLSASALDNTVKQLAVQ